MQRAVCISRPQKTPSSHLWLNLRLHKCRKWRLKKGCQLYDLSVYSIPPHTQSPLAKTGRFIALRCLKEYLSNQYLTTQLTEQRPQWSDKNIREFITSRLVLQAKGSHSGLNKRTPNSNLNPHEEIKSTSKGNHKVNIKFSLNVLFCL